MLIVKYENLKHYDQNWSADERNQADQLGWFLMAIGIDEITEKNIGEILFRYKFINLGHKQTYFVNDPSDKDLINYFKTHIGLEIEITNRGINRPSTRRRWMQAQLDSLEERIERKVEAI